MVYKFELPSHAAIHPVFHVSQLKRALGTEVVVTSLPPQLANDLELRVEHEAVLGFRPCPGHPGHHLEVWVQWKGLHAFKATWEPFEVLQEQFPAFNLKDKVTLWTRGNDKPPIRFTYVRRAKHVTGRV